MKLKKYLQKLKKKLCECFLRKVFVFGVGAVVVWCGGLSYWFQLTRGQEVSGIWRVKGWKRNFLVLRSMATFTMDLDAGASPQSKRSLAFFFQKNPIVSKKQWSGLHYESIECTEWLSLCVTLQSGGPPCAFILTVEKLSVDYQVIATLLPGTTPHLSPTFLLFLILS